MRRVPAFLFGRIGLRRISDLMLVVLGMALLLSAGVLDGERAKSVNVRWVPDVDADIRVELEARFSLAE